MGYFPFNHPFLKNKQFGIPQRFSTAAVGVVAIPKSNKKNNKKSLFCAKIPQFFGRNPGWECICKRLNRSCSSNFFSSSLWKVFSLDPKGILGDPALTAANTAPEEDFLCDFWEKTNQTKNKTKNKPSPLFFCFLCSARRTLNPDGSWNSRKSLGMG